MMARNRGEVKRANDGANLGFEQKLWQAADKLRGHMDAAEYKHATVRLTEVSKRTVMRLLAGAGAVSAKFQHRVFRNLGCRRLQLDELWGFCYCKEKTVTAELQKRIQVPVMCGFGSLLARITKIVPCWTLRNRDAYSATALIDDLSSRLEKSRSGHRGRTQGLLGCYRGISPVESLLPTETVY